MKINTLGTETDNRHRLNTDCEHYNVHSTVMYSFLTSLKRREPPQPGREREQRPQREPPHQREQQPQGREQSLRDEMRIIRVE